MNGILVINKPQNWTSHDVVNKARKLLQEKKIGHTGTLDPLATGVLVLCIGKATKIARYLESDEKEYIAELKLGATTDTLDSDGSILETREYHPPSRDDVQRALDRFRGNILQRPPAYSAIKVSGIPSYRLARQGTVLEHEERPVTISVITLLEYRDPLVRFSVTCSKGTYIRTLCADIGAILGAGAHLTALVRTRSGRFRIEQAIDLEQLTRMASLGLAEQSIQSISEALGSFPVVTVDETEARRISHGNTISIPPGFAVSNAQPLIQVLDRDGQMLAVARTSGGLIRPEVVIA
ncbi:MAG: tRNA pseudouridine(55) synthase TruB [Nitrospirota bacterium]